MCNARIEVGTAYDAGVGEIEEGTIERCGVGSVFSQCFMECADRKRRIVRVERLEECLLALGDSKAMFAEQRRHILVMFVCMWHVSTIH
jgi:hypothetical protein